jgi:integration host factor subunit beta
MNTITKKILVDRIATKHNLQRTAVKNVLQDFLDLIVDELGEGNRIEFRDFGVFEVKHRAARTAQNPKTLERVLSGAQDDIIGLIRSTIGDPTGIGRHASAQASFPGADIPEERTRLPSIADVRKDPFTARDKISEANQAAFAKKLAALRAGADGTSA